RALILLNPWSSLPCMLLRLLLCLLFLFNDTAPTEIYTLSLHDALPILEELYPQEMFFAGYLSALGVPFWYSTVPPRGQTVAVSGDRKSTRLNSSHVSISYAVFCLKKKKMQMHNSSHRCQRA